MEIKEDKSCNKINIDMENTSDELLKSDKIDIKQKITSFFREMAICSLQVIVLTLIIINFIGRVSIVQGQSMYPSLDTNNRIIVNLFTYRFHEPKRGDIIVFSCPGNPQKDYIKRVIGLSGEEVLIRDGVVYIDGKSLDEPYIANTYDVGDMESVKLASDEIFVLGDNRENSEDSRVWGPISMKRIRGKATMRFWPPESFGWFK